MNFSETQRDSSEKYISVLWRKTNSTESCDTRPFYIRNIIRYQKFYETEGLL